MPECSKARMNSVNPARLPPREFLEVATKLILEKTLVMTRSPSMDTASMDTARSDDNARIALAAKALAEAAGLLRGPQRTLPLIQKLVSGKLQVTCERRNLYSYTSTRRASAETLNLLLRWVLDAQRPDGGIAAYYSLLRGYSESYPEVTGYM